MTTPELKIADAIREVTIAMQKAFADGYRSRMIDADDLVEVLLSIADRLDPPVPEATPCSNHVCPDCDGSATTPIDDEFPGAEKFVRCDACGTIFDPTEGGP